MGKHRKRKEDLDRELSKLRRKIEKLEEKAQGPSRSRSPRDRRHTRSRSRSRTRSRSPHARTPSPDGDSGTQYPEIDISISQIPENQVMVDPPNIAPPNAVTLLPEQEVHINEQDEIDTEILAAMGCVEEETVNGPPAHNEIIQRWTPILKKGLKKEEKALLLKQYIPFSNLPEMIPPKLNPELAAAVSEQVKKRDSIIEYRQKNVAAALTAIGSGLECFLTKGNKLDGISKINDASKILCEIIYNETGSRRTLIQSIINKELKDSLQGGPDTYLFGADLTDRIKVAKAVQKSAQDLTKTVTKPPLHQKTLNSRAPPQPRYKRPGFNRVKNENQIGGGGKKALYSQKNSKVRQPSRNQRERSYNRRK